MTTHDSDVHASESSSPAITSRFLFVDVAAQRAIQLRRGARVRLNAADGRHIPHKLERAAMEEVRLQLIAYRVPALPGVLGTDES